MATTPGGYPYPEGTDFVVDGDDAIHALAQTIEDRGFVALAAGGQTVPSVPASGGSRTFTVAFPAGRFTRSPVPAQLIGSYRLNFSVSAIDAASMTIYAYNATGVEAAAALTRWVAVQYVAATALQTFAATAADGGGPDSTITCSTSGCTNEGIPIPVPSTWTDEEGVAHPIDGFYCGVCGADISASLTPAGG